MGLAAIRTKWQHSYSNAGIRGSIEAMTQAEKAVRFRALHERDGCFIIPNPWDIGTARIFATMGFEALATTSAGFCFSAGVGDGAVQRDAMLAHCRMIVEATPLPVSADLEDGYGPTPAHVAETVTLAGETGLAGCSIEDYTRDDADPIYAFDEAAERVVAAVNASRSLPDDFVLTARCENFLRGRPDLADTIRRLQAYEAAGADVLYAPGLKDLDSIRTVCDAVSKPVNVVMGLPGPTFGLKELAEIGVKRISVGSAVARYAYGKTVEAAREMLDHGTFGYANNAIGFADLETYFEGY
jgi:2-methylisocitrate lyase-like PEP mutase family enzyme